MSKPRGQLITDVTDGYGIREPPRGVDGMR
jgi:hypothetical protein